MGTILDGVITPIEKNPFYNLCDISKNYYAGFENVSEESRIFLIYYLTFSNVCLSAYDWTFPAEREQMSAEFLERLLHYKGRAAIVKDKNKGLLVCDFNILNTDINMFGYPVKIQAKDVFNANRIIGNYNSDEFVIIRNNALMLPTDYICHKFAEEITQATAAMNTNVINQKFPIVLQGTKEQKTTLETAVKQIEQDYRYIFCSKDLNIDDIKALNVAPPFIAKELYDLIDRKKNELLTLIGVNNVNVNKQSGVSADEVSANNEYVSRIAHTFISEREKAVNEIKQKFNIDCSVIPFKSPEPKESTQPQDDGAEV